MPLIITLLIAVSLVAEAPDIYAQGKVNGRPIKSDADQQDIQNDRDDQTTVGIHVSIGRSDKRIIREWFSQPINMKGLPPGLAKKERLPPGLQNHLARNGQLPPGLQKNFNLCPQPLRLD